MIESYLVKVIDSVSSGYNSQDKRRIITKGNNYIWKNIFNKLKLVG